MSFLSNAVRFIRKKEVKNSQNDLSVRDDENNSSVMPEQPEDLGFSVRNYAKESFSVLIVHPVSACMQKVVKICSSVITGVLIGGLMALIACLIALQFGSVENTVISALLLNKIGNILPDSDLIVKSAMLQWNSDEGAVELDFKKVHFDNFVIPRITILPDYGESFRQKKLVARTVSIVKPRVYLDIADDFKTVSVNPNFAKGGSNKAYYEPISNMAAAKDVLLDNMSKDGLVRLVNADVVISENDLDWKFKNLYAEYKVSDGTLSTVDFSSILPNQKYTSAVKVGKSSNGTYNIVINSLNPSVIYNAFVKRKTPIAKVLPMIKGYNLPVSGNLNVALNEDDILDFCKFNLTGAAGSIRLPNRNILSLNLGKRIDNGSVIGVIQNNTLKIDSMNLSYGNSGVQLTGIAVPLDGFKVRDTAQIDGTLSLTNVNLKEMRSMLPQNMSESIVPVFHNYLPGFRLESLKFDLKGTVAFKDEVETNKLEVGQGIFKIHDAKIPLDDKIITNVDAIGTVKTDGLDIKLSNAIFGDAKINSGVFFISNKDNSWIGRVNISVPVTDINKYTSELSEKFASLPLDQLGINGLAKLDLKVVRVVGNNALGKKTQFPFRMVEGEGVISSKDHKSSLKISWDEGKLSAVANVGENNSGNTQIKIEENLLNNSGYSELSSNGTSDFLKTLMPYITNIFAGDFKLKAESSWDQSGEDINIAVDLKNATMTAPIIGNLKPSKNEGRFNANVHVYPDRIAVSKMVLDTPSAKFSGQLTADSDWNVTECVLDSITMDGISAQVSMFKKNSKKTIISLIGDSFDAAKLFALFGRADKNVKFVTYLNLKKLSLLSGSCIENVKGTINVRNGRLIKGACIGVISGSTVALNTEDIKGSDDYLISLSASNAGNFLKTMNLGESVNGGTINFVIKASKLGNGQLAGAFEMNNFLVKNNPQLTKLISLSSPSYLTGTDIVVGFNTCTGNLAINGKKITLNDCRAIGPSISMSMKGSYSRLDDELNIKGLLLPMTSVNNPNINGKLASNFEITGSYGNPDLSVGRAKIVPNEALAEEFDEAILNTDYYNSASGMLSEMVVPIDSINDPYSQSIFDKVQTAPKKSKSVSKKTKKTDKKFGVTIKRGLKSAE